MRSPEKEREDRMIKKKEEEGFEESDQQKESRERGKIREMSRRVTETH